jgi:nucleoside-diphosphate-sugar epimerase
MAGVAAHPQYYSIEKARALLGYRPRPIVEAVSGALAWFEANGYLDGPPRHPASSAAAS